MKSKRSEVELAVIGKRFVARLIDAIVLTIISVALGMATGIGASQAGDALGGYSESSGAFQLVLSLGYSWYFLTRREGQTPGKRLMNVRVVRSDGQPPGDGDAIVRELMAWVSGIVFLLGYIWALFDRRNQTWHDKAVGTLVVTA